MPLSYSIDEKAQLITLTASGEITGEDIDGYLAASRTDSRYSPGFRRLIIADKVTGFPDLPQVQSITRRTPIGSAPPGLHIAAVATTPLSRGMIAMFLGHWGLSDRYELFDAVGPAREWVLSR